MTPSGKFGIVGLGKTGANLALQALEKRLEVVGFDRQGGFHRREEEA